MHDLLIVGGGPCGLACAIEAERRGLSYRVLERGALVDGIYRFPHGLTFFSTAELLEIGGVPFPCAHPRPNREEALAYYRAVARHFNLALRLHTEVKSALKTSAGAFETVDQHGVSRTSRNMIFATGFYSWPNLLGIPGEQLPHVSHYQTEAHMYSGSSVVIIGGGNSAVEAALELYRAGAKVTIVHRGAELKQTIKYWVRPDIDNRLREGVIAARFSREIVEITPTEVRFRPVAPPAAPDAEIEKVPAQFVLMLTGYTPDVSLLRQLGARIDPESLAPALNPDTLETSVRGLFVAGSATTGRHTGTIFVENGRFHPQLIFPALQE